MATPEQRPSIDLSRLTLASRTCSELLRRVMLSRAMLAAALELPKPADALNQPLLGEQLPGRASLRTSLEELVSGEPENATIDFDSMVRLLIERASATGENIIAAAVVLCSHSTAGDVFTSVCEQAMDLDPAKWIPELSMDRKVPLALLREQGAAGIFAMELDRFRHQLRAKSLSARAEVFFRHVKIRQHPLFKPTDAQYFRMSRLSEADDLRNRILHQGNLAAVDLEQSRANMLFLHEAASTALRSLAGAYRLPLDWIVLAHGHSEDNT